MSLSSFLMIAAVSVSSASSLSCPAPEYDLEEAMRQRTIEYCIEQSENTAQAYIETDNKQEVESFVLLNPVFVEEVKIDCRSNSYMYPFYDDHNTTNDKSIPKDAVIGIWIKPEGVDQLLKGNGWRKRDSMAQAQADDVLIVRNNDGKVGAAMVLKNINNKGSEKYELTILLKEDGKSAEEFQTDYPISGLPDFEVWHPAPGKKRINNPE